MKLFPRHTSSAGVHATVISFAALICCCAAPLVFSQSTNTNPQKPSTAQPTQATNGKGTTNKVAADDALTPRERRTQAYAKLLEGQRHLAAARSGSITLDSLRLAQQAFRRAAELDPTLSEAHTALAEIAFFFLNEIPEAEREAKTAVRINPDNLGAHRILSRVYTLGSNIAEGEPDKALAERAVAELREVLRLRPNDAEVWALLGEFYSATGRDNEAVDAFRRWAGAPVPIDVRFYQIATKGGELTPDAAQARLAETLLRLGRAREAHTAARNAWSMESDNQRYLELLSRASSQLALTYSTEGRFDDAVNVYEDLLRARGIVDKLVTGQREKQFAAQVLGGIATVRRQAGQLKEAEATIERMRRVLGSDHPTPDIHAVDLLREQGKRQEALNSARAARQRHPEDPRLVYLEATLLAESGRVQEAVSLYRSRLKGTLQDYNDYLSLSSILISSGHGKEAVEAAQKALALAPPDEDELTIQALLVLSSAQDRSGDFKGSEESLRRVLVKAPNNATALNNLGYFLTERNERLSEALEMIQRAVRAEPHNASFLDSLGWVYFKLGKLEEAERYLSDAARRSPNSAVIQEHLGDVLHRLGKVEQARVAWQKALALAGETSDGVRIKAKLGGDVK